MSVTRTFTVTVANPGSGNKFYIDSVLQATVNLAENGTYKFDQSDSSNSGHPLRFSTTSDGTHGGGSEYTTGVTTNGTPGSAEAYTQIVVAESAPTLYYYCANHSGMGGQADTPADNTWGMWAWSTNEWGDQGPIAITLSGQSATSSVGSVLASQIITVPLTAPSGLTSSLGSLTLDLTSIVSLTAPSTLTSAVGALDAENQEGWGRQEWGNSGWGVDYAVRIGTTGAAPAGLTSALGSPIAEAFLDVPITAPSGLTSSLGTLTTAVLTPVPLTAPSQMTSELGSFDNAGTLVGWGRNGWGEEPWGDSFNKLIQPSGLSITSSVGAIAPADVVGLTGVSATSSVGAIAPADVMGLTGVSATTSVGSLTLEIVVPLTAPTNLTSSVGAITPADVMGLTGVSATSSIGSITVTEAQLVIITAPSALSTSVGSVNIELVVPLTAPTNLTASVGAINPADVIGITGVEATVSVGGVSPLGYQDVDITGYTSYTDVNLVA
jgi:hypothetical protein